MRQIDLVNLVRPWSSLDKLCDVYNFEDIGQYLLHARLFKCKYFITKILETV